jgi:hypothetical protein
VHTISTRGSLKCQIHTSLCLQTRARRVVSESRLVIPAAHCLTRGSCGPSTSFDKMDAPVGRTQRLANREHRQRLRFPAVAERRVTNIDEVRRSIPAALCRRRPPTTIAA